MPPTACAGRAGGIAAALVIGAAIATGHAGLAWADEPGGDAGSAASSTTSGTGGTTTNGDVSPPQQSAKTEPPKARVDNTVTNKPLRKKRGEAATTAKPTRTKPPSPVSTASAPKQADTSEADGRLTVSAATAGVAASRAASTESSPRPTTAVPTPKPVQLNVILAVTTLVSGVVNAVLSPLSASGVPGVPGQNPSMWSLLAFARREFEQAFNMPSPMGTPVDEQATSQATQQRTLILSAFPAEADAILARTTLDPNPSVVVDGHHFYLGTLGGKKVIVAMTGIGMVNATQTTETALSHFTPDSGISIGAVTFSGVGGGAGRTEIGDVAVPARWTSDDGATWHAVDPGLLAAASTLDVDLLSSDTIGDPTCYCSLFAGPRIDLKRKPRVFVGGDGSSDDNNNGTAFPNLPSIPFVGDIFGAQPCAAPDFSLLFTGNLFRAVVPFLAFGLVSNLTGLTTPMAPAVDAVDQETAAAQQVADAHGIPFLGIRGMSDGPGDPLHLPGYPFTFVVYKQIAADNAAIVTEALLRSQV